MTTATAGGSVTSRLKRRRKYAMEARRQAAECPSTYLRNSLLKIANEWDLLADEEEALGQTRS